MLVSNFFTLTSLLMTWDKHETLSYQMIEKNEPKKIAAGLQCTIGELTSTHNHEMISFPKSQGTWHFCRGWEKVCSQCWDRHICEMKWVLVSLYVLCVWKILNTTPAYSIRENTWDRSIRRRRRSQWNTC